MARELIVARIDKFKLPRFVKLILDKHNIQHLSWTSDHPTRLFRGLHTVSTKRSTALLGNTAPSILRTGLTSTELYSALSQFCIFDSSTYVENKIRGFVNPMSIFSPAVIKQVFGILPQEEKMHELSEVDASKELVDKKLLQFILFKAGFSCLGEANIALDLNAKRVGELRAELKQLEQFL